MALDLHSSCTFVGPALSEPFVRFDLEGELNRQSLLPKATGPEGRALQEKWSEYRRALRQLVSSGGPIRVRNCVIEPLLPLLGYAQIEDGGKVPTREEQREGEDGGARLLTEDGKQSLRVWTTDFNVDLDAPTQRGRAYRYSPLKVAQRVLLAGGERVGVLTNGVQVRLLLSDPARPDSYVQIPIDPDWKRSREVPDSFRFFLALCCPKGVDFASALVDRARLKQARVTKELRVQARQAIARFVQAVLDLPANQERLSAHPDRPALARELWHEGLIVIYRLLFVLKSESNDDPARLFSFASSSLWRNTFSPTTALARYVRKLLDGGGDTGRLLEDGLKGLFRLFVEGLECSELHVKPLGGALFGPEATPLLSGLDWGERAVAHLLDRLLWTEPRRAGESRQRVHYGPLDVEDLGRVYEALLELEPGIAAEPMCRLRRAKLEVVVPVAQGERYRAQAPAGVANEEDGGDTAEDEETNGRTSRVQWIEPIQPGQFYLRVGLGRKASGSYYTPHPFVRFLIQETLGPQVAERSPKEDPNPGEILKLKVLDPAMGSGHFLVDACRFLGEALYEACRACDEKATEAELAAEQAADKNDEKAFEAAHAEMQQWRQRVIDLPDPDDELLRYLPSRSPEQGESGVSQSIALAISRRLVACHCLYGVDKNPLAVELAKLSLWLESQAEGLPLTFLDHRFVVGDSLTGPFWEKLLLSPGSQEPIQNLFQQNLLQKLTATLREALRYVSHLEATVGASLSEIEDKRNRKRDLDRALLPFRIVAAAWSGGVMLGPRQCDDLTYNALLQTVGETGDLSERIESEALRAMIARGLGVGDIPAERDALYVLVTSGKCVPALPYDLTFPEVFYPHGVPHGPRGFHAVVGNPPWEKLKNERKAFLGAFRFAILATDRRSEWEPMVRRTLAEDPAAAAAWSELVEYNAAMKRVGDRLYTSQIYEVGGIRASGDRDLFIYFGERGRALTSHGGALGMVLSGGMVKNPAALVLRNQLFLVDSLTSLRHFHNRHLLFADLPGIVEFCVVVVRKDKWQRAHAASVGLDLDQYSQLEAPTHGGAFPLLSRDELRRQGGALLILTTGPIALAPSGGRTSISSMLQQFGCDLSRDLDRSEDGKFRDLTLLLPGEPDARHPSIVSLLNARGYLPLWGARSIAAFSDIADQVHPAWDPRVRMAVEISPGPRLETVRERCRYYRLCIRATCGSPKTNARSLVSTVVTPGAACTHKIAVEAEPWSRPNGRALLATILLNSFTADALIRPKVQTTISKSVMADTPAPSLGAASISLLAHSGLRLVTNHANYSQLWHEQLGDEWRESGKEPFTWPVLATEEERWEVRSAIDAVVAQAYGLTREQYEHVLHSFDRASGPNPHTDICLAKFDELHALGLDAFTRKYDPYWDIPLVETLPEPVIDLPLPADDGDSPPATAQLTNLLGEPVPTNLLGEVVLPKRKKAKRTRRR